jgi:hypothetical protein
MGAPQLNQPFPFFKETETNQKCCGCNGNNNSGAPSEIPQINAVNPAQFNTMPSSSYINNGNHFMKIDNNSSVEMLNQPVLLGTGQLNGQHSPNSQEFERARTRLNLNLIHKDKK